MPRTTRTDTLSQTQRLILDSAAQHPERRLTRPEAVKPPTYRSALQALRRRGLIADGPATDGSRTSAGPVLTKDGLALLGLDTAPVEDIASAKPAPTPSLRLGTKQALLVARLTRPDGASLDEFAAATAWLPHTTRAALTGLRKRGFAIRTRRAAGETTRYCLAVDGPKVADASETTLAATSTAVEAAAR